MASDTVHRSAPRNDKLVRNSHCTLALQNSGDCQQYTMYVLKAAEL